MTEWEVVSGAVVFVGDDGLLAPGDVALGMPPSKLNGEAAFPLDQSLLMDGREDCPPSLKIGGA